MDTKTLHSIVTQIHRRFPEFSGVQPKVQQQNCAGLATAKSTPTYLITFHSRQQIQPGPQKKFISRWVRVVATGGGKILKISTSR